jgi:tetratricopeptide (TPR) repeat protein
VLILAPLQRKLGATDKVVPLLRRAESLAEALGRDRDAVNALRQLAEIEAFDLDDQAAAHVDLDLAKAKGARLGGASLRSRGILQSIEAEMLKGEHRLDEAEAVNTAAISALEQAIGRDEPEVGVAYSLQSQIERALGKTDEAVAAARHGLAVLVSAVGEEDVMVANTRRNLSRALAERKEYDEAREQLRRADETFQHVFGPDHETRASVFSALGALEMNCSNWNAAIAAYRTELEIYERVAGPTSERAGSSHADVGEALEQAGKDMEAIAEYQRSIAIFDSHGASSELRVVQPLLDLAGLYLHRKHRDDIALALAASKRAVAIVEKTGSENPDYALAHTMLARAQNAGF